MLFANSAGFLYTELVRPRCVELPKRRVPILDVAEHLTSLHKSARVCSCLGGIRHSNCILTGGVSVDAGRSS